MFCNNCGKNIAEKSSFCTWCGSKLNITEEQPVPQPEEAAQSFAVPAAEAETSSINQAVQTEDAPEYQEETAQQSASQPYPEEPSEQPLSNEADGSTEQPSTGWNVQVPLNESAAELPQKSQKYYTGGQLALCLVITGIMAAAAGVFAGLYFSVIL